MVHSDEYGPFEKHIIGGKNIVLSVNEFGRRLDLCDQNERMKKVVHSDECGPFKEHTIGGNNILLSIDEFCRRLWIYVIKLKGIRKW